MLSSTISFLPDGTVRLEIQLHEETGPSTAAEYDRAAPPLAEEQGEPSATGMQVAPALDNEEAAAAAAVDPASFLDCPRAAHHILCAIKEGRDDLLTEGVFRRCPIDTVLTGMSATHWDFGGHGFLGAKSAVGLGVASALGTHAIVAVGAYLVAVQGASAIKNAALGGANTAKQRVLSKDDAFERACGFPREQLLGTSVVPLATSFWDLTEGDTVRRASLTADMDAHWLRVARMPHDCALDHRC